LTKFGIFKEFNPGNMWAALCLSALESHVT